MRRARTALASAGALLAVTGLLASALPTAAQAAPGDDPRIVAAQPAAPSGDGSGNFRIQCGVSHHVADDPIVRPNQPSGSHMHAFAGNTAVDAYSTATSIRTTGESTCHGGTLNRSGYWIPSLYDADGRILPLDPWHVYYKHGTVDPASVRPMPQGLRMVAGNAAATSAQPLETVRLSCGTTPIRRAEDFSSAMPACAQGDFVAMSVIFPQCWTGRELDSSDHTSHMAYAQHVGQPWHVCPATHPVPLPQITVNLHQVVREARGSAGWRLSSDHTGQPGGQTLHSDWFDGWDPAVVETFVAHCIHRRLDCSGGNLGDGTALTWFQEGENEHRVTTPAPGPTTPTTAPTAPPTTAPVQSAAPRARCAPADASRVWQGPRQRQRKCARGSAPTTHQQHGH